MSEVTPAAVRERISEIIEPLRQQAKTVDEHVEHLESNLRDARQLQRELRNALKAVDPEFAEERARIANARVNGGSRRKERTGPTKYGVSNEMVNRIYDWLVEIAPEEPRGFVASSLPKRPDSPTGQSQLSKVFKHLHDDGRLRLDGVGRGGAKIYKLARTS